MHRCRAELREPGEQALRWLRATFSPWWIELASQDRQHSHGLPRVLRNATGGEWIERHHAVDRKWQHFVIHCVPPPRVPTLLPTPHPDLAGTTLHFKSCHIQFP